MTSCKRSDAALRKTQGREKVGPGRTSRGSQLHESSMGRRRGNRSRKPGTGQHNAVPKLARVHRHSRNRMPVRLRSQRRDQRFRKIMNTIAQKITSKENKAHTKSAAAEEGSRGIIPLAGSRGGALSVALPVDRTRKGAVCPARPHQRSSVDKELCIARQYRACLLRAGR